MLAQYGENCIRQRKVYQCVERFHSGRTSVTDGDFSGCLTTSQMLDVVEQINTLVQEERQIIVTDIADKLYISCGSSHSIIHKDLMYHKI
jgi:hypothetical protein